MDTQQQLEQFLIKADSIDLVLVVEVSRAIENDSGV